MTLAHRLNELSLANSDGLLNDDDYRILRQNAFQEYSDNVVVPVEQPIVPTLAKVHVKVRASTSTASTPRKLVSAAHAGSGEPSDAYPVRAKTSMTSGVANLLRRATGRKALPQAYEPDDPRKRPSISDPPKRSVVPRLLHHKKHTELPQLHVEASRLTNPPSVHPRGPYAPRSQSSIVFHTPPSPARSTYQLASRLTFNNGLGGNDIFHGDNLDTAQDIRNAIAIAEDEAQRLLEAFLNLESSAINRYQRQNARYITTSIPRSVSIRAESRERRETHLTSSTSLQPSSTRVFPHRVELSSDGISIRSGSSNKTSLSLSKSISSLRRHVLASPISADFRKGSVNRKNSMSSVSSRATSLTSGHLGVPSSAGMSRSTGYLPLHNPRSDSVDQQRGSGDEGECDDEEINDIRKRKQEVTGRYVARIEYLRAKLKGAELHEKLMRK